MNDFKRILILLLFPLLALSQNAIVSYDFSEENSIEGISTAYSFDFEEYDTRSISNTLDILLSIPKQKIELKLKEVNIYATGFQYTSLSNKGEHIIDRILSRHYVGRVGTDPNSRATINVRDDKISGVVRYGNTVLNLGYSKKLKKHFLYEHGASEIETVFSCKPLDAEQYANNIQQNFEKSSNSCSNAVNVYFECDHEMFLNFNSDTVELIAYIEDLFTEVNALYGAEDLSVLISQISIWTSDDPYSDDSSGIYDFENELNNNGFNGDIAQLLTNDPGDNGGQAYVDQLCGSSPYAYCDITNTMELYPAYSWDVQVLAHEMGHLFGSQHTHDCVWGPAGNEQIDDCGNVHTADEDACYDPDNPIIPSQGGTVMSYCHLDPVGIDFMNGFGPEPGALIRDRHSDCFCDNPSCDTAMELVYNGNYTAEPNHGNGASSPNATHADWFYFVSDSDGTISVNACGAMEDTRLWIWEGVCDQLTFVAVSDDDCDMGNGDLYASELIDIPVTAGMTYYIEWDDRWSTDEFGWNFEFIPSVVLDPCDGTSISVNGITQDTSLHAKESLLSDCMISNGLVVDFKAGTAIELNPGFELEAGAVFQAIIADCQD